MNAEPLTALDALLTADERRVVSVDQHAHFQRSLAVGALGRDEIDRELADLDDFDPLATPAQRRSEKQTSRLMSILDDIAVEELRRASFEESGSREDGQNG